MDNNIKNIARRMHKKATAHIRIGLKEIENKLKNPTIELC